MKVLRVFDKDTHRYLGATEILDEVNRDRTTEWTPYDAMDLLLCPEDLAMWIDPQFYEVMVEEFL